MKWENTSYFCPNCGERKVWRTIDGEDYYAGEQHMCVNCGRTFALPDGVHPADTYSINQLVTLRKAIDADV